VRIKCETPEQESFDVRTERQLVSNEKEITSVGRIKKKKQINYNEGGGFSSFLKQTKRNSATTKISRG
jgi:hypothetical protein